MDIIKRLLLVLDEDSSREWHPVISEAIAHIESLRKEIRTQRYEIAGLREERNVLLEWDRPQIDDLK